VGVGVIVFVGVGVIVFVEVRVGMGIIVFVGFGVIGGANVGMGFVSALPHPTKPSRSNNESNKLPTLK
jgi:hypothetical protein